MVIVGDLHLKNNKYSKKIIQYFFNWLLKTYSKNELIILLGDLFDKSIMPGPIIKFMIKILLQFDNVIILEGNHDTSFNNGSLLEPLTLHPSLKVINSIEELTIEDKKCLFLPFTEDLNKYAELSGTYDYIFAHFSDEKNKFQGEGIDLPTLKGKKIYGHIHIPMVEKDVTFLGVPYPTRLGEEENSVFRVLEVKEEDKYVDVPKIFTFHRINYGDEVHCEYPFFKLIIENSESKRKANIMYKDYDIHESYLKETVITGTCTVSDDFTKKKTLKEHLKDFFEQDNTKESIKNILEPMFE